MDSSEQPPLDDLDLAILTHLETDGRKSFSDIAADLGVTVSTVSNRVKKLIDNHTLSILGWLDPHQVGFNAPALLLISAHPSHVEEVAAKITKFPEVGWLAMIAGEFDLVAEVQCRDTDHLTELLTKRIHRVEGVRETRIAYQLRQVKIRQPSVRILTARDRE